MAALDFPNAPTIGQVFDRWMWDGVAWTLAAQAGTADLSGQFAADISGFSATVSTTKVVVGTLNLLTFPFARTIYATAGMLLTKAVTYVDLYLTLETTAPGGSAVSVRSWRSRVLDSGASVDVSFPATIPAGYSARLIVEVAAQASGTVASSGSSDLNHVAAMWTAVNPAAGLRTDAVESADYIPVLTNFTVGTTGTPINDARYTFVGGPNPGDKGIMHVSGRWQLGTNFTMPNTPAVNLPPGFAHDTEGSSSNYFNSQTTLVPTGANPLYLGQLRYSGSQLLTFVLGNVASTYPQAASVGASIPVAWVATGYAYWAATLAVRRL